MINTIELFYLLKTLKTYEKDLILTIFDLVFYKNYKFLNCSYDLELIFKTIFGFNLSTIQINNLTNNVLENINIKKYKMSKISKYNLHYYVDECINHYLKHYNSYYSNIYKHVIEYNNWVIQSYSNLIDAGILVSDIKFSKIYLNNRIKENQKYQKKLDKKEKIIKQQISNIIF